MKWLALQEGWNVRAVDAAHEKCLELKLINEFYWNGGKALASPDRRHQARLYYRYDVDAFEVFLVISNRSGRELGWTRLVRRVPMDADVEYIIYKPRWKNNTTFILEARWTSDVGKNCWEATLSKLGQRPAHLADRGAGTCGPGNSNR
jgi:hypothetical protein